MRTIFFIIIFSSLFNYHFVLTADDQENPKDINYAIRLDAQNFYENIDNNNTNWLVMFYNSWCNLCFELKY